MMTSDLRVQELIAYTKQKMGLHAYHLHASDIHLEQTIQGSMPILTMEWFPNDRKERTEEGLNPPGTAVVDVEIRSRHLRKVIFTKGLTLANKVTFKPNDLQEIIHWIEQETELTYEKHFSLSKQEEMKYIFRSSYEGIPLSPSGHIRVELDHAGRLVFFTIHGEFPDANRIQSESYSLTMDKVIEQLAFEQFKLVQFPLIEQQAWQSVYGLEEIYITNDKQTLLPFTLDEREACEINRVMEWEAPSDVTQAMEREVASDFTQAMEREAPTDEKFEGRPLFLQKESLSLDEALTLTQISKPFSISEQEKAVMMEHLLNFLRKEFAKDSGKWLFKRIFRDDPYVIAELVPYPEDQRVPIRKLRVFLDANHYEVVNYMDKGLFLSMFESYSSPGEAVIGKQEAFAQIKDKIELTPVYVYDFAQQAYRLCGKLDCKYAVLVNGEGIVSMG